MQIKDLCLFNYRNIKELYLEADKRMNVIYGENAQGKTNIIEAIWLFCGAKSFRNQADSSFIKFGEKIAKSEINFEAGGVLNNAKIEFNEKKTAYLNEKPLQNPSKLAESVKLIVFSPADLSLVSEGPEKRRKFLDLGIAQLYPQYIEILKNYTRAVKQRNLIIKDYKYDASLCVLLDSYEEEIAQNGVKIIKYRDKYVKLLSKYFPDIYNNISCGREKTQIKYIANVSETMLKEMLELRRREDSALGVTSIGPHRDDIEIEINGINARSYGSQGQKRSVSLSLKFSQAEISNEKFGEYPVCLLDDVMSELDEQRQNYILNHIKDWQSFITCCDINNIEKLKNGKVFHIKNGEII